LSTHWLALRTLALDANPVSNPQHTAMSLSRIIMIEDFAKLRGGATMIAHQTAKAMRRAGLEVIYLAGDGPDPADPNDLKDERALTDAGVVVHRMGNSPLLERGRISAFSNGLHDAAAAAYMREKIATYGGHGAIVHVHGYLQTWSPSVFAGLAAMAGKIVLHAHDFFYVCPNGSYFNFQTGTRCTVAPMSGACLAAPCDKRSHIEKLWRFQRTRQVHAGLARLGDPPIIALHEGMVPILTLGGVKRGRIEVHRNPVAPWTRTRVRAESNSEVLFVGRLAPEKGLDLVAQACKEVGAPLSVYGSGSLRDAAKAIYPQAQFHSWAGPAELEAAAHRARFFILATRQVEAFGLTVFEAGLSGLPVVLSPLALVADEVEKAGFAMMANPERVGVLAETIATLMVDDARIKAMSEAGFAARNSLGCDIDQYATTLIDMYQRTLHQAQRRTAAPTPAGA
jgi:glycosyltransferase involved in cell wall biosynthesis